MDAKTTSDNTILISTVTNLTPEKFYLIVVSFQKKFYLIVVSFQELGLKLKSN